jgi:hypothetical protein
MFSQFASIIRRLQGDYPECSFSIRQVDADLWVASVKGKDGTLRAVLYLRGDYGTPETDSSEARGT